MCVLFLFENFQIYLFKKRKFKFFVERLLSGSKRENSRFLMSLWDHKTCVCTDVWTFLICFLFNQNWCYLIELNLYDFTSWEMVCTVCNAHCTLSVVHSVCTLYSVYNQYRHCLLYTHTHTFFKAYYALNAFFLICVKMNIRWTMSIRHW